MENNYNELLKAFFDILASDNTISHNRILSHAIGNLEAQMYQCLLSKMYYYSKNDKLSEDGFFYATVYDIEESTTLTQRQQLPIARKLEEIGLIKTAKKGIPAKKYYKICFDMQLLLSLVEKGNQRVCEIQEKREQEKRRAEKNRKKENTSESRCSSQYEQNVCTCSTDNSDTEKVSKAAISHSTNKMSVLVQTESSYLHKQNVGTCTDDKSVLAQTNCSYKKLYNNKTITNNLNNQSINQSKEIDGQTDDVIENQLDMFSDEFNTEQLKQQIRENISYDLYMTARDKQRDKEYVAEIYKIICDVVCVPRRTVKINGTDYPYETVKSVFLKLNSTHIEYVRDRMSKNTTKIENMRAYLITALYNSYMTPVHYYESEVNHDMYGGAANV